MENELFLFNRYALQGAITAPLCAEYKNLWRQCGDNKKKLVDLVLSQQALPYFLTHCYQGKGLSKEYILDEFKDYINGNYVGLDVDGVEGNYKTELYVAKKGEISVIDEILCIMWSNVLLSVPKCRASKIYVGCNSNATISCDGYNSLTIMLFDSSKIVLDDIDADTTITIYKYSDKCEVELGKYCFGKVNEFTKELKL